MSNISQFFGGTETEIPNLLVFTASGTFTTPADAVYHIFASGGGGSGGAAKGSSALAYATGGGAGGCCRTRQYLPAGTVLTITVGAGGASVSASGSNAFSAGNAGGTTTVSGTGLTTMTANGGAAGDAITVSTGVSINGGTGGTASGGNVSNVTGGRGGNIGPTVTGKRATTGGGAVGIYSVAYSGIDHSGNNASNYTVTGAPGVGGIGAPESNAAAGGGSYGPATGTNIPGPGIYLTTPFTQPDLHHPLRPKGYGGYSGASPGPGGGGYSASSGPSTADAGLFAGGGACYGSGASSSIQSGDGGLGGGGSGGGESDASTGGSASSGTGGDGLVVIEW